MPVRPFAWGDKKGIDGGGIVPYKPPSPQSSGTGNGGADRATCPGGGIGRRAGFRYLWQKCRGSSSLLLGTIGLVKLRTAGLHQADFFWPEWPSCFFFKKQLDDPGVIPYKPPPPQSSGTGNGGTDRTTCPGGGIGRRAGFRYLWQKCRGSSSLLLGTIGLVKLRTAGLHQADFFWPEWPSCFFFKKQLDDPGVIPYKPPPPQSSGTGNGGTDRTTCPGGGIGRRAGFRYLWQKCRGSSSLLLGTIGLVKLRTAGLHQADFFCSDDHRDRASWPDVSLP